MVLWLFLLFYLSFLVKLGSCSDESDSCLADDEKGPGKRCRYESIKREAHEQMVGAFEETHFRVITKTTQLNAGTPESAKRDLIGYFTDSFDIFSDMYRLLLPHAIWNRADPLRHPPIWYLGHCSSFLINKLRLKQLIDTPLNANFETLFAIGVDEMSWDDKLEDRDDWPSYEAMWEYRDRVRSFVLDLMETMPMTLPITWNSDWWTILMGIEHERIHLETSSVLFRQMPLSSFNLTHRDISPLWSNLCPSGAFTDQIPDLSHRQSPPNKLIRVSGGHVSYGRTIDDPQAFSDTKNPTKNIYGWDNEYGEQTMDVPSFSASKFLVSNEDFYEFILQGKGYQTRSFWTDEGWRWVKSTGAQLPMFWIPVFQETDNDSSTASPKNHYKTPPNISPSCRREYSLHNGQLDLESISGFRYRHWIHETDLPLDWPVIVNELEAEAYTNYLAHKTGKSIRLPTEDEWFLMRTQLDSSLSNLDQMNWKEAPGNVNLEYFISESPIDMFEFGKNTGFYDVVGNAWQHTLTPQHPFKGFVPHPIYDDFTIPCFGSHHNMIKGGSWISTGNEASMYSRYQFRRHFYQHASIRYVESDRNLDFLTYLKDESPYTDSLMVDMYTHFHFWDEKYFNVPNFAVSVANVAIKHMNPDMTGKALDLGCATGRSSFELARVFDSVIGIDFTARLIGVGYRLKEMGFLEWKIPNQGDILDDYRVTLNDLKLTDDIIGRVHFAQNDAQNLDAVYTDFDLVVAANLIDRLANPMLFLKNIHKRINIGGKLVLLSPYTWLTQYTQKENWIGGKYDLESGEGIWTPDALKSILRLHFDFEGDENVEMVIRETGRKFQHTLSHCTVWKRKSN